MRPWFLLPALHRFTTYFSSARHTDLTVYYEQTIFNKVNTLVAVGGWFLSLGK